ncbi:MFS transporter [Lichenihabitans psoromatis]|uniref:MFS transporter n=1 Tax=Lichenihabitans psoromatis TaxID=2528642 RepID=UPI0010369F40|nr:MFS transporter [Lichenihabitans psoromatis]
MTVSDLSATQPASGARPPDVSTPNASQQSRNGLDWFVFFIADIQTGFGPFVAVYLTAQKWTQTDIGLVLTVAGLVSLLGQIPAGAVVDAVKNLRAAAAIAVLAIGGSAFAMAIWPVFPLVMLSRVVHAGASCVLGLALASISLSLVGRREISGRLGRNASFASIGTGLAAAGMGLCGTYLSPRSVFFVSGALVLPALIALFRIKSDEIKVVREGGDPAVKRGRGAILTDLRDLARIRPLVIFSACIVMFHLANAAMLPLAASMLTLRSSSAATALVAAAIVVPQVIVAILSPIVGLKAQKWGRKPLLLIGFAALPLRGLIFSLTSDPRILVAVQALDGVSAAALGVLVPLTIADVTAKAGRFNLAQGAVGCAVGIGAAISTTIAGSLSDHFGSHLAFVTMATVAGFGFLAVWLFMPETLDRPAPASPEPIRAVSP